MTRREEIQAFIDGAGETLEWAVIEEELQRLWTIMDTTSKWCSVSNCNGEEFDATLQALGAYSNPK